MEDLVVNTIFIFDLKIINKSMRNKYISERFGMKRSEDDLSWVLIKLAKVFTQSLDLLA
jgi:hypothetical protein